MVQIPSTPADGNIRTVIVTEVADPYAPTVAELEAGEDISCYLTPGGFALTTDQGTITDERECSTQTFGQPGRKTYGLTVTGIDNTNSTNEAEYNALVESLTEGAQRYAYRRRGLPYEDAWDADQTVTVVPFIAGVKQEVASEANSVLRSTWQAFITGDVEQVAVTAGA